MYIRIANILSVTKRREKGFTLIELLIVVAIIAILAAIAIPQFASYRRRGYNASALSDARNIRTTEEAMFADTQDYGASEPSSGSSATLDDGVVVGPGGTVRLVGGVSGTSVQSVVLSPNVYAVTEVYPASQQHTSFLVKTGHATGDQYYGAESDNSMAYRKGYATAGSYSDINAMAPPASTSGSDFNVNNWIFM